MTDDAGDAAAAGPSSRATGLLWAGRGVAAVALMLLLSTAALPWYVEFSSGVRYTWSGWEELGLVAWLPTGLALALALVAFVSRNATALDVVAVVVVGLVAGFGWFAVVVETSEPGYRYGVLVAAVAAGGAMVGTGLWIAGILQSWATRSRVGPITTEPAVARAATVPAPPAGWYSDPAGRAAHRWWSGSAWTEHVG